MYLIKELGLEKCKQIVDGAPEGRDTYCLDAKDYFKQLPIMKRCSVCVDLGDLRTAIANHEKCQHDWNETTSNGDAYRFFVCKHCDSTQNYVPFKDDNPSHFDHCADIGYHISPLTRVIEK